jgi:cytochrome P450
VTTAIAEAIPLRSLAELPGPRGWPVLGNVPQLAPGSFHLTFEDWVKRYGPLYRISWAGRPVLVVADAALNAEVFRKRPDVLRRASTLEAVFSEMGGFGVFAAEGEAWRQQRALVTQGLTARNLRGFYPTLRTIGERLYGQLAQAAESARVCEIVHDLKRFTVDVTTLLAFDTDVDTLRGGSHVLQRHLELIFPAVTRRVLSPIPYWRWFKLPADRRLDRALSALREFQRQLVEDRRSKLRQSDGAERSTSLIDTMILARDDRGRPFDDDVIYSNMMVMLLGGEDTTAQTVAWALHHLCERPDLVAAARAEIDAAFGPQHTPPDFEAAARMPLIDAIVQETMRLRPIAPVQMHEALEELVVGDVIVPRDACVCSLTRVAALDARNFDAPEQFRPQRWLRSQTEHVSDKSAHMPFGFGPRICPGRSLALVEMRVVLAMLLKSFDLERVGRAEDVRENYAFTMAPDGLYVRFRPRE